MIIVGPRVESEQAQLAQTLAQQVSPRGLTRDERGSASHRQQRLA
jgi:hypothetical protein